MKEQIIIAGSRNFSDYNYLKQVLDNYLQKSKLNYSEVTIISGTAKGADCLGERYAQNNGIKLIRCPANWSKYGKYAGYKRNEEMAFLATQGDNKGVFF